MNCGRSGDARWICTLRNRLVQAALPHRGAIPVFQSCVPDAGVRHGLTLSRVVHVADAVCMVTPWDTLEHVWDAPHSDFDPTDPLETSCLVPTRGRAFADKALRVVCSVREARLNGNRGFARIWASSRFGLLNHFRSPVLGYTLVGVPRDHLFRFDTNSRKDQLGVLVSSADTRRRLALAKTLIQLSKVDRMIAFETTELA